MAPPGQVLRPHETRGSAGSAFTANAPGAGAPFSEPDPGEGHGEEGRIVHDEDDPLTRSRRLADVLQGSQRRLVLHPQPLRVRRRQQREARGIDVVGDVGGLDDSRQRVPRGAVHRGCMRLLRSRGEHDHGVDHRLGHPRRTQVMGRAVGVLEHVVQPRDSLLLGGLHPRGHAPGMVDVGTPRLVCLPAVGSGGEPTRHADEVGRRGAGGRLRTTIPRPTPAPPRAGPRHMRSGSAPPGCARGRDRGARAGRRSRCGGAAG
jgi:hypothetical protein